MKTEPDLVRRYRWAGELARAAMSKIKRHGEKPRSAADDDPPDGSYCYGRTQNK